MPPTLAAIPSARRISCDSSNREERDRSGRIQRKLDSFEFLQRASPAIIISAMPHGGRRSGAPSCLTLSSDVERPLFASRPILTSGDRPNGSADPGYRPWSLERPFAGPSRGQGALCRIDRDVQGGVPTEAWHRCDRACRVARRWRGRLRGRVCCPPGSTRTRQSRYWPGVQPLGLPPASG